MAELRLAICPLLLVLGFGISAPGASGEEREGGAEQAAHGAQGAADAEGRPASASLPPEAVIRRFLFTREEEDWRWLARGSEQPSPFDALKYLPFDPEIPHRGSLGFGGELQTRFESIEWEAWGLTGRRSQDYALWRARLHADVRVGARFRLFTAFQAAGVESREGGPRPSIDRDDLDVQQAFAELALSDDWLLRAGRQELGAQEDITFTSVGLTIRFIF